MSRSGVLKGLSPIITVIRGTGTIMTSRIAPSILAADFGNFAAEVRRADEAGGDWIHCDVMDGHFVPNISFGADVIRGIRGATQKPLDVHLMIERPDLYLERFIEAGADHVIVHVEAQHDVCKTLAAIRARGKKAGVAINPATPVAALWPLLDQLDEVLVMTVNPGFGGQAFIPEVLPKIREIRARAPRLPIVVDGGINPQTGRQCAAAGADVFVAGNSLFKHKSLGLQEAVAELRKNVTL